MTALRLTRIDADWFHEIADRATMLEPDLEHIDGMFIDGHQVLGARGTIFEHTDPAFPRWSYCLILLTDGDARLKSGRHPILTLERGMLVELDIHKIHALRQPDDQRLIWYPWDSDVRVPLDEAAAGMHEAFCTPGEYAGVLGH